MSGLLSWFGCWCAEDDASGELGESMLGNRWHIEPSYVVNQAALCGSLTGTSSVHNVISDGSFNAERDPDNTCNSSDDNSYPPRQVNRQSRKDAILFLKKVVCIKQDIGDKDASEYLGTTCGLNHAISIVKKNKPKAYADFKLVFDRLLEELISKQHYKQSDTAKNMLFTQKLERCLQARLQSLNRHEAIASLLSTISGRNRSVFPAPFDGAELTQDEYSNLMGLSSPFTTLYEQTLQRRVTWDPNLGNQGLVRGPNGPSF